MKRAYSLLTVKAVNEDERIIEGIATTPTADRAGDVVEPKGAEFKLPIPLLWQHDSHQPIGHVLEAKVTSEGIRIKAKLTKVEEDGVLKNRLDEAWQSIKSGLVGGLSIGFKPLESARIGETWSYRFLKWLWLELSAVTIPANGECTITAIKSLDAEYLAASGRTDSGIERKSLPGASGHRKPVNLKAKEAKEMTIREQIEALEAKRAANVTAMEAIAQKGMDEGRSMDAAEQEEFDNLQSEVENIDGDLKRLKSLERLAVQKAAEKPGIAKNPGEPAPRNPANHTLVLGKKLPPGVQFARVVKCIGLAKGSVEGALMQAQSRYADDQAVVNVLKAAVAAGSTSNTTWAGNLVGDEASVYADFVEFLRPMTIIGKFGQNGVPALRSVPFRVPLIGQTSGGNGYWVGEGQAKPVTKFDFSRTTLTPLKCANIAVLTEEVLRDSNPSAELLVRDSLAAALREVMDKTFIDPTNPGVTDVRPASIVNGIAGITSNGSDAAGVRADVEALLSAFITANNPPSSGVIIMSALTALKISLMRNALGQKEFPDLTMNGGTLEGFPVITSEYITATVDSSGQYMVMVNASDIYLGDEGGINIDMSREASLQMDNAPTNNSTTPTATQLVSLWQTNSVGFRAERTINWSRRRSSAVAWVKDIAYQVSGE